MTKHRLPGALTLVELFDFHKGQVIGYNEILGRNFPVVGATEDMLREQCLVRLGIGDNSPLPRTAYLVGSKIPGKFPGIVKKGSYVLLGQWDRHTMKLPGERRYPQFDDVDHYFNPGEMTAAVFMKSESTNNSGRYLLMEGVRRKTTGSIGKLVSREVQWQNRAPVIIYEGLRNYENLVAAAFNKRILPVTLEPRMPL